MSDHPRPDYCDLKQDIGRLTKERDEAISQLAAVTRERDEAVAWQKAKQEWIEVAAATMKSLLEKNATAVEALEWYAGNVGEYGNCARKALAAIRGTREGGGRE